MSSIYLFVFLQVFFALLALSICCRAEESDKKKRGIFGEAVHGATHGGVTLNHGLSHGAAGHSHLALGGPIDLGDSLDFGHDGLISNNGNYRYGYGDGHGIVVGHGSLDYGNAYGNGFGYGHGTIDLGHHIHKHITITNKIGIPIPHPYPVHIQKNIPVPVPHPVPIAVDKPYPVHIPRPYPVPVDKPVPYTVVKPVPYPVHVTYKVPVNIPVPVAVPKPIAVPVHKPVPVPIPYPVKVAQEAPVYSRPTISVGSGSLGVVKLANGNYALGSGSLGYSNTAGKVNIQNRIDTSQNVNGGTSKDLSLSHGVNRISTISFGGHNNIW